MTNEKNLFREILNKRMAQEAAEITGNATFMEEFGAKKPFLNVATIGHVDHGKTTLTSALTITSDKLLAKQGIVREKKYARGNDQIDATPEEMERKITINTTSVVYETDRNFISHTDCPGHVQFIKNCVNGIKQTDLAILVLCASSGVMHQTREHIVLARQILDKVVVYINKVDIALPEYVEMAEDEVLELLARYNYNVLGVVKGSAKCAAEGREEDIGQASIEKLFAIMDGVVAENRSLDLPFKLPVDGRANVPGRGVVLTGVVQRGIVNKGQEVEFHYRDKPPRNLVITDIQSYHRNVSAGIAGANIGVLVRGLKAEEVGKGAYLSAKGTHKLYKKIKSQIYIQTSDEGGRGKQIKPGFAPHIFVNMHDHVTGQIKDINGIECPKEGIVNPGVLCEMTIDLQRSTPFDDFEKAKSHLVLREGTKSVGLGYVTDLI